MKAPNMLVPLVAVAVAGVVLLGGKRQRRKTRAEVTIAPVPSAPENTSRVPPGKGAPMRALAAGSSADRTVGPLLRDLDAYLGENGVDLTITNAEELTRMKTGAVAIPPRSLWPNIIPALILWQEHVRRPLGFPMTLGAYRSVDYNSAVGGAPRSLHQWFAALDIRPAGDHNTAANRRRIALAGARAYLNMPSSLKVGYGAYGAPDASNIHLDTGFEHRSWRDAPFFIGQLATA